MREKLLPLPRIVLAALVVEVIVVLLVVLVVVVEIAESVAPPVVDVASLSLRYYL